MVARHDQTKDPALLDALLQARRGTAFFAHKLNEPPDAELDGATLLPGWTGRHVVAHVGYNARAIARLIEWAATGVETPMYSSPEARNHEIDFGSTLSPIALRHLFDHSAGAPERRMARPAGGCLAPQGQNSAGANRPGGGNLRMRTREVWIHAVDLDNGATFSDIPAPVLERLLKDITGAWHTRGTDEGLLVKVTGTDLAFGDTSATDPKVVAGSLPCRRRMGRRPWFPRRHRQRTVRSGRRSRRAEVDLGRS